MAGANLPPKIFIGANVNMPDTATHQSQGIRLASKKTSRGGVCRWRLTFRDQGVSHEVFTSAVWLDEGIATAAQPSKPIIAKYWEPAIRGWVEVSKYAIDRALNRLPNGIHSEYWEEILHG
jgi:hypothetical protein